MPVKLSTTISKIESLSNSVNSSLISELCEYMKKNGLSFLGMDTRAMSKKKRIQKERQAEIDATNDDDVKRELKKGHTMLSYSEHQPQ